MRYLRQKELIEITGMTAFYWERLRWAKEGPPYAKLGRAVLYPEGPFYDWLNSKLESAGTEGVE
jgi:predicted DNA-binding transcriptional regulator AlpA